MRGDLHGFGIENKTHVIEEMAAFAEDASAAFGDVRIPVRGIEFAGHAAIGKRHGAGCAGEELFEFLAGGGETAIESDLDGCVAVFVSAIDFAEFFAREADRFFNEDLTLRFERGEHEWGVEMMAGGNDDCAIVGVLLERGVGVGFGALKTEFCFDVICAE